MANPYFGALGDVWKHLLLAEVLRLNPPTHYWETHAGSASYRLTESSARDHGAIRFVTHAPQHPALARSAYWDILRGVPGLYPGSALLALSVLGSRAQYLFCETDSKSAETLRDAGAPFAARVVDGDGIAAIERQSALTDLDPGSVFVHIDPFDAHERMLPCPMNSIELAASLGNRGYRVFYWYGYDSVEERGWAHKELARSVREAPLWCGDVTMPSSHVYPGTTGAWGCGVILLNVTESEASACAALGDAFEQFVSDDPADGNEPSRLTFATLR